MKYAWITKDGETMRVRPGKRQPTGKTLFSVKYWNNQWESRSQAHALCVEFARQNSLILRSHNEAEDRYYEMQPDGEEWIEINPFAITPHKGGRTERIEARIAPQAREQLNQILAASGESFADWLTKKASEEMLEKYSWSEITLSTKSGGTPKNADKLPASIEQESSAAYHTVRNGTAHTWQMTFMGRVIGWVDARSAGHGEKWGDEILTIYETDGGFLFSWLHFRGSAEYFDSGYILPISPENEEAVRYLADWSMALEEDYYRNRST